MSLRGIGSVVALVLAACGPARVRFAELDDICGEPGPFRVLALAEGEAWYPARPRIARVDDRVYFVVSDVATPLPGTWWNPSQSARNPRVVSTGLCGESPRIVAEGMVWVGENPRWPGVPLGARQGSGDLFVLDPEGVEAPRLLLPQPGIYARSDHGVVSVVNDGESFSGGNLVLQPYPASIDDALPEPILLSDNVFYTPHQVVVRANEVVILSRDFELLAVALPSGTASVLAEDVGWFSLSQDGARVSLTRFRNPDVEYTVDATILDRATGIEAPLADGIIGESSGHGFTTELLFPLDDGATRIVALPTLEFHDTPAGVSLWHRADGDVFFGARGLMHVAYDRSTGVVRELTTGDPRVLEPDAMLALEPTSERRRSSPLHRHDFRDGDPVLLAERATIWFTLLTDGRVVTAVEVDDDFLADLVLVDPTTLQEQRIDEAVSVWNATFAEGTVFGERFIAYAVEDGERSGIWLARPSAH